MTLEQHIAQRGNLTALSRALGVSHSTVLRWIEGRVPAERVRAVAAQTGIPPHELRPDLFDAPASEAAA
jgi:DNA-binding transcriptional regulator YdaS (Cro superfamily)